MHLIKSTFIAIVLCSSTTLKPAIIHNVSRAVEAAGSSLLAALLIKESISAYQIGNKLCKIAAENAPSRCRVGDAVFAIKNEHIVGLYDDHAIVHLNLAHKGAMIKILSCFGLVYGTALLWKVVKMVQNTIQLYRLGQQVSAQNAQGKQ